MYLAISKNPSAIIEAGLLTLAPFVSKECFFFILFINRSAKN
jgi:hypothetical protein